MSSFWATSGNNCCHGETLSVLLDFYNKFVGALKIRPHTDFHQICIAYNPVGCFPDVNLAFMQLYLLAGVRHLLRLAMFSRHPTHFLSVRGLI